MEEFIASGMHWRIFNFLVFLSILTFVLRKPVKEFWLSRAHQIGFEREEATRLRQEASRRHDEMKKKMAGIEGEIRDLIRSLEAEGEFEKKRMMEETERLARRLREDTERIAAQEVKKAIQTLKVQAVELAVELADRLLRENVNRGDQKRMVERYLQELEEERA